MTIRFNDLGYNIAMLYNTSYTYIYFLHVCNTKYNVHKSRTFNVVITKLRLQIDVSSLSVARWCALVFLCMSNVRQRSQPKSCPDKWQLTNTATWHITQNCNDGQYKHNKYPKSILYLCVDMDPKNLDSNLYFISLYPISCLFVWSEETMPKPCSKDGLMLHRNHGKYKPRKNLLFISKVRVNKIKTILIRFLFDQT